MKKFTALFLIFSLVMLSANLHAKERRGAKLIITKTDGQQIEGELITVKPNSLLLLDTEGKDVSIDIADIKIIKIVKEFKALELVGIGSVTGALSTIMTAAILDVSIDGGLQIPFNYYCLWGAIGLGFGAFLGLVFALSGLRGKKTIRIEGKTDFEINEILEKLRKKARIRDYK